MIVDYSQSTIPAEYVCSGCGKTGVKLWREYSTFTPRLFCAICAGADQHIDISDMDVTGKYTSEEGRRIDQIGWLVPAVPDEEGIGFWEYTSVPATGVAWWMCLPTK